MPKLLTAAEAKIGTTYLVDGLFYSIKILKKHGDSEEGYVSSVLVESETEPLHPISIAGGTELLPFSEKLHRAPTNVRYVPVKKRVGAPRSVTIDIELAAVLKGKTPDWEAIATAVINAGSAKEDARKSVIMQAKARYAWYTKDGKTNPATKPKGR